MKRVASIGIVLILAGCNLFTQKPAVNPDPNHTHADFAVWINGKQLDFSDPSYMSTPPAGVSVKDAIMAFPVPIALAHGTDEEHAEEVIPGREYLHLHDGNGHVIHAHKPGLTIGEFFTSIGLQMTSTCFMLDTHQMEQFDSQRQAEQKPDYHGFIMFHNADRQICTDAMFQWQMFVNGEEHPFNPSYQFKDIDHILLSYNNGDVEQQEVKQQLAAMTDDACLYSQTCPERGEPPVENCIADPAVPCVE